MEIKIREKYTYYFNLRMEESLYNRIKSIQEKESVKNISDLLRWLLKLGIDEYYKSD